MYVCMYVFMMHTLLCNLYLCAEKFYAMVMCKNVGRERQLINTRRNFECRGEGLEVLELTVILLI